MTGEVRHPQGLSQVAQVLEEAHPLGHLPKFSRLLGSKAGGKAVLNLARGVKEGDDAVLGGGQVPRAVQHPLEHRLEVQAFVDAAAGLAETGEAFSQGGDLFPRFLGWWHGRYALGGSGSGGELIRASLWRKCRGCGAVQWIAWWH